MSGSCKAFRPDQNREDTRRPTGRLLDWTGPRVTRKGFSLPVYLTEQRTILADGSPTPPSLSSLRVLRRVLLGTESEGWTFYSSARLPRRGTDGGRTARHSSDTLGRVVVLFTLWLESTFHPSSLPAPKWDSGLTVLTPTETTANNRLDPGH